MKCERCGWDVRQGKICDECQRVALFKLAARIAGRAILSQPNMLLRVRLVKKFFGVCVNTWETLSILGSVHSAVKLSRSPHIPKGAASA
jgi:hypothetical protein